MTERYFGKYRGVVTNNIDPMQIGRIQAMVPDVSIIPAAWCTPCVPITGKQAGMWLVPQIGAGVWIEFEQGDPDHPIWTGCFWGSAAEVPAMAKAQNPVSPSIVLQTGLQNTIAISDVPGIGGITLKIATGGQILINDTGIFITNGKGASISLVGPTVTINNGALAVT
jgi:hypothetical protein